MKVEVNLTLTIEAEVGVSMTRIIRELEGKLNADISGVDIKSVKVFSHRVN